MSLAPPIRKKPGGEEERPGDVPFLTARATRFYTRYAGEVEQITKVLEIRLNQLALAYTIDQKLPQEAVTVKARMKSLKSFLKKLERKGWPHYYYVNDIATDLIGARVCCWFLDDCKGMFDLIVNGGQLRPIPDSAEDYIARPKPSGYRSMHLLAQVPYDRVTRERGSLEVLPDTMTCEIQIRTKLMDAWGDLTHEFHYKAKALGITDTDLENVLAAQSDTLHSQDKSFLGVRNVYQRMIRQVEKESREGFRD